VQIWYLTEEKIIPVIQCTPCTHMDPSMLAKAQKRGLLKIWDTLTHNNKFLGNVEPNAFEIVLQLHNFIWENNIITCHNVCDVVAPPKSGWTLEQLNQAKILPPDASAQKVVTPM
jgi:hypothetical protein